MSTTYSICFIFYLLSRGYSYPLPGHSALLGDEESQAPGSGLERSAYLPDKHALGYTAENDPNSNIHGMTAMEEIRSKPLDGQQKDHDEKEAESAKTEHHDIQRSSILGGTDINLSAITGTTADDTTLAVSMTKDNPEGPLIENELKDQDQEDESAKTEDRNIQRSSMLRVTGITVSANTDGTTLAGSKTRGKRHYFVGRNMQMIEDTPTKDKREDYDKKDAKPANTIRHETSGETEITRAFTDITTDGTTLSGSMTRDSNIVARDIKITEGACIKNEQKNHAESATKKNHGITRISIQKETGITTKGNNLSRPMKRYNSIVGNNMTDATLIKYNQKDRAEEDANPANTIHQAITKTSITEGSESRAKESDHKDLVDVPVTEQGSIAERGRSIVVIPLLQATSETNIQTTDEGPHCHLIPRGGKPPDTNPATGFPVPFATPYYVSHGALPAPVPPPAISGAPYAQPYHVPNSGDPPGYSTAHPYSPHKPGDHSVPYLAPPPGYSHSMPYPTRPGSPSSAYYPNGKPNPFYSPSKDWKYQAQKYLSILSKNIANGAKVLNTHRPFTNRGRPIFKNWDIIYDKAERKLRSYSSNNGQGPNGSFQKPSGNVEQFPPPGRNSPSSGRNSPSKKEKGHRSS